MIRYLINLMHRRAALARYPERLLRDIGIEVGDADRWRPFPAPTEGRADATRYLVMAPLRS